MGRSCSTHGEWEEENAYRVLVGTPEGKKTLIRPSRMWDVNIRMYLRETGWSGMARINLTQNRDQWRLL
jgi:hypothetical protein